MATHKTGTHLTLKVVKSINRDAARKTVERIFLKDKAVSGPIEAREKNFKALPKRRGGRIWTKRPNKTHHALEAGTVAHVIATPQTLRDLASVADFVTVSAK